MLYPLKVIDIDISQPVATVPGLVGYQAVHALIRWGKAPVGWVEVPIENDACQAERIVQRAFDWFGESILKAQLQQQLLANTAPQEQALPLMTIAVCTRDRATDLVQCLDSLMQIKAENFEILVVDNAPSDESTATLVAQYPQIRYVQEPRPGLDWARNRAVAEASGELIAFTDDDTIVDPQWLDALRQVFMENPWVGAVTGLVVPHELETPEQIWFEMQGGFGRGCQRKWLWFPGGKGLRWYDLGTGNYGTGANMAFRRSAIATLGGFDPALDVGTKTQGAGDLEMFLRLLRSGYGLVYEPQAIVWHRHRRDYQKLRKQLAANGSVYSMFMAIGQRFPDLWAPMLRLGLSWGFWGQLVPWLMAFTHPTQYPQDLRWVQLVGSWRGLWRYGQSKREAQQIAQTMGAIDLSHITPLPAPTPAATYAVGIYPLELTDPLPTSIHQPDCHTTRLFVTYQGRPLQQIDLTHYGQPIGRLQLAETLVNYVSIHLFDPHKQRDWFHTQAIALNELKTQALPSLAGIQNPAEDSAPIPLPTLDSQVSVSIVIGTFNRPDALARCLKSLADQETTRPLEIIVVDNCPQSGQSAPIVSQFPQARYVAETRQGVAYARNAGIVFSTNEIIVTVDDDVVIPADWLEKLIAPLARADVMGVTGNVLPWQLETPSQQIFETYGNGGLGRGFVRFEVGRTWFERSPIHAVPTWELGGTANSAYRAAIFRDPAIGLMDTALGPGMPSGVGEDIYLFYKILKAGYTMVYEPTAHVWHEHRRDMNALRRQLYNYSKGFTSYHLTTLMFDRDWRSLVTLFIFLPLYHTKRLVNWPLGDRKYPLSLILWEIWGNLVGFVALPQSRRRVERLDRAHLPQPQSGQPHHATS